MDEEFECSLCGKLLRLDDCDSLGCCDESVFCWSCNAQIDPETGDLVEFCGKCEWCQEILETMPVAGESVA